MYGRQPHTRHVAKFTVLLMLGLYFAEWYIYNILCKPSWWGGIMFNTVLFLAAWSYLRTSLTDPGTFQSPEWVEWSSVPHDVAEDDAKPTRRWAPGKTQMCTHCEMPRPERAHHCSCCGVCVLRMDHHCPWTGNCIGWRNHKYFLLFNFWSFLACVIFLATLRNPGLAQSLNLFTDLPSIRSHTVPMAGIITAALLAIISGGIFTSSTWMVSRNATVVEDLFTGENPYCLKNCSDNFHQLVGPLDLWLLLPVEPCDRLSNGTAFPAQFLNTSLRHGVSLAPPDANIESTDNPQDGEYSPSTAYGTV